jgi:hypothetical protein
MFEEYEDWVIIHLNCLQLFSSATPSLDPGLPLPNPTKSSWQIPPDPLQNYQSSDRLPTDLLDVVVIGSGFSGTAVAWHLLDSDESLRVLMFEAREVCSGATGRNGIHTRV